MTITTLLTMRFSAIVFVAVGASASSIPAMPSHTLMEPINATIAKVTASSSLDHKHPMNYSVKYSVNGTKPKLSLIETSEFTLPESKGGDGKTVDDEDDVLSNQPPQGPNFLSMRNPTPASGSSGALDKLTAALKGSFSPTAESRKETMATMESTIMNLLLGKSAFGATPMGGSVKKIVNILTHEMKPKIKDAHKADQTQLHKLMSELKKCFSVRDDAIKSAAPWNVKYKKQSKLHKESEQMKLSSSALRRHVCSSSMLYIR
jgi:hypothetical protein